MQTSYSAQAGSVELAGIEPFHNEDFGYTLFEEVVDPANPEGPRAIAMHVPAHALSKVWELVEPGYKERIELLEGTASLVVNRAGTEDWTTMPLDSDNPTADDVEIMSGDMFCIVTEDDEAVVLSRPSKPFDISFEEGKTTTPADALSRFVLTHVGSLDMGETGRLTTDQIRQFFAFMKPRSSEAPELQVVMDRALSNPEHATDIYNQYMAIIDRLSHLSGAERERVEQAWSKLTGGDAHSASHYNASDILSQLDTQGKAELAPAITDSVSLTSRGSGAAIDDFTARTRDGHNKKMKGETPTDGDPDWDRVIYGHTVITDPEALLHFSIAHYLERYYSQVLPELGVDFAATQKDYFINAMLDVLMLDHFGDNKFAVVFDAWSQPREQGGMGWIKEDHLKAYAPNSVEYKLVYL